MTDTPITYADISTQSMVQIFRAADALQLPPADVAALYLASRATDDHNQTQAPEPALAEPANA